MTIVIPTKNSSRHIDIILEYYLSLGLRPWVFVDDASIDDTYGVCRRSGCRTTLVRNPLGRVEGIIEAVSAQCDEDWILRFDDDEVPSLDLLHQARDLVLGPVTRQYAFRLRHCVLNDRQGMSALRTFENPPHDQWRLYNRRHVAFTTTIHTPGIILTDGCVCAPDKCFLHLQWIVRSYAERRAKVEHYDRQVPNSGTAWRSYYLVEENGGALRSAYRLDRSEFAYLGARLSGRFPAGLRVAADPLRMAAPIQDDDVRPAPDGPRSGRGGLAADSGAPV